MDRNVEEVLKLSFESMDLDKEITIREYLIELLKEVFIQGESFSGKRPFGNSGWMGDLAKVFIKNKIITGTIDPEYDDIDDYDDDEFDTVIMDCIKAI